MDSWFQDLRSSMDPVFGVNTLYPALFSKLPMEEMAIPFPSDEHTPPVTNMYLVIGVGLLFQACSLSNFIKGLK